MLKTLAALPCLAVRHQRTCIRRINSLERKTAYLRHGPRSLAVFTKPYVDILSGATKGDIFYHLDGISSRSHWEPLAFFGLKCK